MNRKIAFLFVAALALSGCGNSEYGHPIDQNQVQQFKPGVTTYDQVIAAMGQPAVVSQRSDGTKIIAYSHMQTNVRGATYVPVVGLFAGGAGTHQQSVVFTFDQNGVLKDYQTMNTQACSGNGVMSDVNATNCQTH